MQGLRKCPDSTIKKNNAYSFALLTAIKIVMMGHILLKVYLPDTVLALELH